MLIVEVGFKLDKSLDYYHEMLINNGAKNVFNVGTHDIYWSDKNFDGYIEIRFKEDFTTTEIDDRGLYKHIINFPNKYPYPLYIISNLVINTSKIINDNIIKLLYELKSYTRSNYTLCVYKNKVFLYINNWELRITDSFRQKLTYNSIDKKIDSFTRLVDDLQNLYICILRNYEVIKYGKWNVSNRISRRKGN